MAWLLSHAAALTLAPLALGFASAHAEPLECTCEHADHARCPMHHTPSPGAQVCLMQCADDSAVAVLNSLFIVGIETAHAEAAAPEPTAIPVVASAASAASRPTPPDPPPPRA